MSIKRRSKNGKTRRFYRTHTPVLQLLGDTVVSILKACYVTRP
jgi:hypothetical protein